MKVGFVVEPHEPDGASGMGYLVRELATRLPIIATKQEFTLYSAEVLPADFLPMPFLQVRIPKSFLGKVWWFASRGLAVDALLFITPLLPLLLPGRVLAIPICPELVSQKIAPRSGRDRVLAVVRDQILMPWCLRRAAKIVTISDATKKDIVHFYRIPEEMIVVIHAGFQDFSNVVPLAAGISKIMQPFFFFTGRAKPRKNVHGIVAAFIQFKERTGAPAKLVLAGKASGLYYEELNAKIASHGFTNDVFFVGYVSIEELCSYYKQAIALVFPSFNEGFGMPVVEAMSVGTPVITSNTSSLPEVGGDAALLVDPDSVNEISNAMEKVFTNADLRADMTKKGFVQARKFSWDKAAREYAHLVDLLAPQR